jgi:hypothetical protein
MRRTVLSKNTLSRCTAELQALGMIERRRVHQAGGTAYNLFFLLPGAHLDKYNTLHPRQPHAADARPARPAAPPPHPTAGRPTPTGTVPPTRTLPAVGTNSRSSSTTTTPPPTRGRAKNREGPVLAPQPAPPGGQDRPPDPPAAGAEPQPAPAARRGHPPPDPPALSHARHLYESEIGRVSPLVDDELRHLVGHHPDPSAWDTAFREAVRANVRQLRYVGRVLDARAHGTTRKTPKTGGPHVPRKNASRRPASHAFSEREYAEARRRAAAIEPLDLLATLGTANA